jgi:EAL domain-containing protein (putative c-di-GMP-specific phosphodiesterase class I)
MSCPHCEASPVFHGRTVHIWAPQQHTLAKLDRACADTWPAHTDPSEMQIRLTDVEHAAVADKLAEVLTEPEQRDCRLVVTAGEAVTAAHIPSVLSVESYVTTVHGAWLEDILGEDRLSFAFQPIVDANRRVHGHEALVRAQTRDGDRISPAQLFGAAGTPSLLATLDRQARLSAVAHMPTMPEGTRMFINFMPSTIYDPVYCLQTTARAVESQGMDPSSVVFEVVESDKTRDSAHLKSIVEFYRRHGYSVALDDFGTGHNNLSTLLDFRPDYIKVDKAITGRLTGDSTSRGMVRDLVHQAAEQGTYVIAEGIENAADFAICIELGIEFFQGFHFAKPEPRFSTDADVAAAPAGT